MFLAHREKYILMVGLFCLYKTFYSWVTMIAFVLIAIAATAASTISLQQLGGFGTISGTGGLLILVMVLASLLSNEELRLRRISTFVTGIG